MRSDFDRKVSEITCEADKKQDIIKQHSEFVIERGYLENQVSFYKSQLEENKRLHDGLLIALQCISNSPCYRFTDSLFELLLIENLQKEEAAEKSRAQQ